jgi:hypothetical protein
LDGLEIILWWSIDDANITLGEDPEYETKEIHELLDEDGSNAEPTI